MIFDAPFYPRVPKLPDANLRYRRKLLEAARRDRGLQRDLLYACKTDILFWINAFCWLYEPRMPSGQRKVFPFISFGFQDLAMQAILRALGIEHIVIEKSRDLGGTWMVLYVFLHQWLFGEQEDFGVVSRDMDAVDKTGNKGCLFWKLRFMLGYETEGIGFPSWMTPRYVTNKGVLLNQDNASAIVGYPATSDELRGDRKRAILCDEFSSFAAGYDYSAWASAQFVANCVILMSSPSPDKGASGCFYDEAMKARK